MIVVSVQVFHLSCSFCRSFSGHGYFGLPEGLGNVIIPVFGDEPTSIVAYTLASAGHASCVTGLSEEVQYCLSENV